MPGSHRKLVSFYPLHPASQNFLYWYNDCHRFRMVVCTEMYRHDHRVCSWNAHLCSFEINDRICIKFSKQHAFLNAYRDPLIQLSIIPANNFILSEHHKGIWPCNWPFSINIPTVLCIAYLFKTAQQIRRKSQAIFCL